MLGLEDRRESQTHTVEPPAHIDPAATAATRQLALHTRETPTRATDRAASSAAASSLSA